MTFHKRTLSELAEVYAVRFLSMGGSSYMCAASEGHGPCLLFAAPQWDPSVLAVGPGGVVSVTQDPGTAGTTGILAIMEFFPVFQSEGAGVFLLKPLKDPSLPWTAERLLDLPFAHRIEVVRVGSGSVLVAATLCGGKDFRDDWSKPGSVYVGTVPQAGTEWDATVVLDGITKNHGMSLATFQDSPAVLVSGEQGVFELRVSEDSDGSWRSRQVFDHEVSDVCAFDLDSDGHQELITIEPFHGDTLCIYRLDQGKWQKVLDAELAFGHALWAGTLRGQPAILAGNRAGSKELLLYRIRADRRLSAERIVVDAGVGATQVTVLGTPQCDLVLSANHAVGEVALYAVT